MSMINYVQDQPESYSVDLDMGHDQLVDLGMPATKINSEATAMSKINSVFAESIKNDFDQWIMTEAKINSGELLIMDDGSLLDLAAARREDDVDLDPTWV